MVLDSTLLRVTVTAESVGATEVTVAGELDAHTAPLLADVVRSLPSGPRRIDATGVTFVGSCGLTALLELHEECRRNSDDLVIDPSASIRRLAEMTGLDILLPLV